MKIAVGLSAFMPYGAPELLAGGSRRLSHALLAASAAALALYAAATIVAPRFVNIELPDPIVVVVGRPPLLPPPAFPPPLPRAARRPAAPSAPTRAEPVPVPDVSAPPSKVMDGEPDVGHISGGGRGATDTEVTGTVAAKVEPLPRLGEYVHMDQMPEPIFEFKPEYPELAKAAGVEGLVVVRVLVGKDGSVLDAVLDDRLQSPLLNAAALDGARRWRFTPALRSGHAVPVWTAIPFRFTLH